MNHYIEIPPDTWANIALAIQLPFVDERVAAEGFQNVALEHNGDWFIFYREDKEYHIGRDGKVVKRDGAE